MSITYKWTIDGTETFPFFDGKENVISEIYWKIDAYDGDYNSSSYGSVKAATSSKTFINYEDITEESMIGFVKESLGIDLIASIEAMLEKNINNMKNPETVRLNPPWQG